MAAWRDVRFVSAACAQRVGAEDHSMACTGARPGRFQSEQQAQVVVSRGFGTRRNLGVGPVSISIWASAVGDSEREISHLNDDEATCTAPDMADQVTVGCIALQLNPLAMSCLRRLSGLFDAPA